MRSATSKALDVCPGDSFLVRVPPTGEYSLDAGDHLLRVERPLAAKVRPGQYERKFIVSRMFTEHVRLYLALCVPQAPELEGWAFLARDERPVQYWHQQNIQARLLMSLEDCTKL